MNSRQRFNSILDYGPTDAIPVMRLEPYEDDGIVGWRSQGLPEDQSPDEFLGISSIQLVPVHTGPVPAFEQRIIAEDAETFTETDWMGCTVRRSKAHPTMYYGFLDHPVKTREDWERYKTHFRLNEPERVMDVEHWAAKLNASEMPVGITLMPWLFRLGFYSMGMERFMTAFYETPDLIHDMFSHWSQLVMQGIRPFLGKAKIDVLTFAEDLAYKGGPHLSPEMYKEFFLPYQDPVVEECRAAGVKLVNMYTSGNIFRLLPLLMERGFNLTWPLERACGMDPVELRRTFGRELRLAGGVPKEALIAGPEAIDREIERLIPLIREGGYIPAVDDMVPPEVSFDNYRHYIDAIRAIRL